MDCSAIELKVISCKDLRAFNFFQKLSVYAVVSIFSDEMKKEQEPLQQLQKTPIDRDNDGNPEWNHTMSFDTKAISSFADQWDLWFLKFELRNDGALLGKSLGIVQVPLKELVEEYNGAVRFMSYQVKGGDGKSNGVLDFSYSVVGKNINNGSSPDSSVSGKTSVADPSDQVGVQSLYPTLELENLSRDMLYPSLADVSTPLPIIPIPSPNLNMPFSPPAYDHHKHHHHRHHHFHHPSHAFAPFVQPPGMHWHPSEFTNHGCSSCGNPPRVGQFGMIDYNAQWRSHSLVQAGDPETTANARCY